MRHQLHTICWDLQTKRKHHLRIDRRATFSRSYSGTMKFVLPSSILFAVFVLQRTTHAAAADADYKKAEGRGLRTGTTVLDDAVNEGHGVDDVDDHQYDAWSSTRIVGGRLADQGEYPFFVQGAGCGASLIWKDIALTAAHCAGVFRDRNVLVGAWESYVEVCKCIKGQMTRIDCII